jgi:hypothetical protein
VGFADNTNLLVVSHDTGANCWRLESAYCICEQWARTRGIEFAPQKSELMHFSWSYVAISIGVCLADRNITPVESARFLGVWLDRKLQWGHHLKEVKKHNESQKVALTKLVVSVWGCSFAHTREIYTKVICTALVYGASAWHDPGDAKPKGPACSLAAI